jgi:hypothetical protein
MNTSTTVAQARELLFQFYTPADPNSVNFLRGLNKVSARLINDGKWKGNVVPGVFDSSTGYITLPYEVQSILSVHVNGCPEVVFNEFFEYVSVGPGELRSDLHNQGLLVDMGDGWPCQRDIETANYLKFILNAPADAGKTVRIFGTSGEAGSLGEDLYDSTTGVRGMPVTLAYPSVTTNFKVQKITGLQFQSGRVGLTGLYVVTSGDDYFLSRYYPFETNPTYKRYKTQTTTQRIGLKFRRRWVQMTAETDWVYPGNLAALQLGLQALKHEETGYLEEAMNEWAAAVKWLNDELRANHGSAIFPINWAPFGPYRTTAPNAY